MTLYKYCANGNDFLLFHTLFTQGDYADLARAVCDRHSGIGADGLVALLPFSDDGIAYQWDFYNADGSRANMCGNASRCAAHYAYNLGLAPREHSFITHSSMQAQVIKVRVNGQIVSSNLGLYRNLFALSALPSNAVQKLDSTYLPTSLLDAARWFYIDTGVPHLVCFVQDLAIVRESSAATKAFMQELRKSFNANVNLAYAASGDEIYLATYERGVEDITLACGTGMAATLLVGYKVYGLESSASLVPPSGDRLKLWCEPIGDSALGEQFDKIENFVKGTTAKVANLPQNSQSLQSPTAKRSFFRKPRILEENQASPSLRALLRKAWQSISAQADSSNKAQNLESSFDNAANSPLFRAKPTPEQKVDSSSKLPTLAHINELESKAYSGDMEVFLEGEVRCVAVCQTCYD
ncbi:diaminopimelate epimerase [Helicobacter canis]|uniref:diaminopimelate epimerase n=1 Tax=Helicobacter canis TaxID=29419 RepID=UPI0026F3567E|nr:diaminopimelate epimerase [Helicobacter canis]